MIPSPSSPCPPHPRFHHITLRFSLCRLSRVTPALRRLRDRVIISSTGALDSATVTTITTTTTTTATLLLLLLLLLELLLQASRPPLR